MFDRFFSWLEKRFKIKTIEYLKGKRECLDS